MPAGGTCPPVALCRASCCYRRPASRAAAHGAPFSLVCQVAEQALTIYREYDPLTSCGMGYDECSLDLSAYLRRQASAPPAAATAAAPAQYSSPVPPFFTSVSPFSLAQPCLTPAASLAIPSISPQARPPRQPRPRKV